MNDNYYYNNLSSENCVPLLKETYNEAKAIGLVAFKHWMVSEEFLKYSIYEYDFASDCPGGLDAGYFLRKRFPWLTYKDQQQEIVKYWQKQIAARFTVKYVDTEREKHASFSLSEPFSHMVSAMILDQINIEDIGPAI